MYQNEKTISRKHRPINSLYQNDNYSRIALFAPQICAKYLDLVYVTVISKYARYFNLIRQLAAASGVSVRYSFSLTEFSN